MTPAPGVEGEAMAQTDRVGTAPPDAPEHPGAVILARHGEPALSRKVLLSAAEYRDWWGRYEDGGIAPDQTPPAVLQTIADKAGFIIASARPRSIESARLLARARAFAEDPIFVEAPLPPPDCPAWLKLSPRLWGFISRVNWWFFDQHHGEEPRAKAQARATEAARQLVELAASGQDVLVVAHGFFNGMVGRSLQQLGWRRTLDEGFRYWAARRFESAPR
jgi:broad specificity phosphatase PhoE